MYLMTQQDIHKIIKYYNIFESGIIEMGLLLCFCLYIYIYILFHFTLLKYFKY